MNQHQPNLSSTPSEWFKDRQFGVVLDAGSSGTRIQVYSWKSFRSQLSHRRTNHLPTKILPRIQTGVEHGNQWQLKVEPGISSFGSHPHHVGQYLKPLLDHALKLIPTNQISSTPFYLLATAGMRLLPQSQQDKILDQACSYIKKNYKFWIDECSRQVRIISGEEEGIFGWISVNYLMDGFNLIADHQPATTPTGGSQQATFGFLDMGGASTQIAFEPNQLQRIQHSDNLTNLTLRLLDGTELTHSVFVTTWLGYGTNKARERYSEKLVKTQQASINQPNPDVILDPCLPTALLLPSPSAKYQFNGTGDFTQCLKNISPLLNKNAPCLDKPCLFDGKHVPPIDFSVNRFIGISEYWYSTQDLWSMGGIYDFVEFEKKAINYCKQNWDEIVQDQKTPAGSWPTKIELSRLESQCFKAAWIINVLHEGIGFPRIIDQGGQGDRTSYNLEGLKKATQKGLVNHPPNFQSLNEVGNITVSWTLGKIVLELSQLSDRASSSSHITPTFLDPQLGGLKNQLSTHAKSYPITLLIIAIGAIVIWFIYLFLKSTSIFQFRKESYSGQGYTLASMEEGDVSRRESRSPRSFRKPSLSSPRNFLASSSHYTSPSRSVHQVISRAIGIWRSKKGSISTTRRSISTSRPNSPRSNRPSRIGSPNPSKFIDMSNGAEGGYNDEDQREIIQPVSITTSLSAPAGGTGYQSTTSARTSIDEGLFASVPISRTGSSAGSNGKAGKRFYNDEASHRIPGHSADGLVADPAYLYPDRPKQRFVHSKSFQSLSTHRPDPWLDLDSHSPPIHRDPLSSSTDTLPFAHPRPLVDSQSCSNLKDFS